MAIELVQGYVPRELHYIGNKDGTYHVEFIGITIFDNKLCKLVEANIDIPRAEIKFENEEMFYHFGVRKTDFKGCRPIVNRCFPSMDDKEVFFTITIPEQEEKNMELKDTVEMMNSKDYKERFRAEYIQNKIRYDKLDAMTVKYEAGTLPFEPKCSLELLKHQKSMMGQYIRDLKIRAEIEEIDLEF